MIAAVAKIPDVPLAEALALVNRFFDETDIGERQIDAAGVVDYYRQSELAYRMFHSHQGALHIGLVTEGTQPTGNDVGHARHAELFATELEAISAQRVIEFGCGTGYNVGRLAKQYAAKQFVGVDLSPRHIAAAQRDHRHLTNVAFQRGNYQCLDYADAVFDAILAVETLCQTEQQAAALSEAFRLLRPGGRLVVIDCFRNGPLEQYESGLARAARLVEKTAAVDTFAEIDSWLDLARSLGFQLEKLCDRSAETAHDLARLYRLARRFFNMSLAVKLIRKTMPALATENAVCGLLMPYTVGHGPHGYYSVVLGKPVPPQ